MIAVRACFLVLPLLAINAHAGSINLGSADSVGVLSATPVIKTGPSGINGDPRLYSGASISGFPPRVVNRTIHRTYAVAIQDQADTLTAYNDVVGLAPTMSLPRTDLGGLTLTPGIYEFNSPEREHHDEYRPVNCGSPATHKTEGVPSKQSGWIGSL